MADRQLKILVRTEIQKGFSELAKQIESLSSQIGNLNKTFANVATSAQKAATATSAVNKTIDDGVKLANQYALAQTKVGQAAEKVASAQKAGSISNKARIEAELNLLAKVVKTEEDLNRIRGSRNSKGQFGNGGFSPDIIKAVSEQFRIQNAEVQKQVALEKQELDLQKQQLAVQRELAFIRKTQGGFGSGSRDFGKQFGPTSADLDKYMNKLAQAEAKELAFIRKTQGGFGTTEKTSSTYGASSYRFVGGSGGRENPETSAQRTISAVQKMSRAYTELGHFLFQLEYSTYTFFAVTGIEAIAKQIDKYTELQNEIARTTQKTQTLAENMQSVFDISRKTFTGPEEVGKLFSRINTYSGALGYTQPQVSNTTQNLQSAISISAVNNAMKLRANTELSEILSGNQAGGRQLQALQREAPLVGQVLQQYVAKQRGMPPGSAVDLHEKGLRIDAKTTLDAFNEDKNPGVTAKLGGMISNRNRTTDDLKELFETDLMQYMEKLKTAFSFLQDGLNKLAAFLQNQSKFEAFMNALGSAAIGLTAFGATLLAQAGYTAVGKGIAGAAGAVGRIGTAVNAASMYEKYAGSANMAMALGNFEKGEEELKKMGGAFEAMTPGMQKITKLTGTAGPLTAAFGVALDILLSPLVIAAAIIGLLAARFNYLLNKFGDGINVFDIIKGVWDNLIGIFQRLDQSMGGPIDKILKFVDRLLMRGVEAAKNDPGVRFNELQRVYGIQKMEAQNDGFSKVTLANGRVVSIQRNIHGNMITANGNPLIYDPNTHETYKDAKGGAATLMTKEQQEAAKLSTGYNAPLPPSIDDKARQVAERIRKFFNDLAIQAENINNEALIPEQWLSIQKKLDENKKKLLDILGKDKFDSGDKALVDRLNAENDKIKKGEVEIALKKFNRSLADAVGKMRETLAKALMTPFEASHYDNRMNTIQEFAKSNYVQESKGGQLQEVQALINSGNVAGAEAKLKSIMTPAGQLGYNLNLGTRNSISDATTVAPFGKQNDIFSRQLQSQSQLLGYFGKERELQQQIVDAKAKMVEVYGPDESKWSKEATNEYNRQVILLKEQLRIQDQYNANWKNGFLESLSNYSDGLKDVAGEFKQTFDNVFKGLEDAFVSFIQTGKLNLGDMLRQFTGDLTRTFVRQSIMKPITNFLGRQFGLNLATDPADKMENALKLGGDYVAQRIMQAFGMSRMGGSSGAFASEFNGAGGGSGFSAGNILRAAGQIFPKVGAFASSVMSSAPSWISTAMHVIASIFHDGGVAGMGSVHRAVSPSVFNGAMRYHTGGLAGLKPDEVPAILQRGERIIPRNGRMGGSIFAPSISISYTAAPSGQNSSLSPEEHAKQISDMVQSTIRKEIYDYERRSHIPGTDAYVSRNTR